MIEIPLGKIRVPFGNANDSERLRTLVGNEPCAIDLDLDRFPRLGKLPEGVEVEEELFVINYEERFPNNNAVAKRHQDEGFIPKSIFHLIAMGDSVPELWKQRVVYVEAGDSRSFWLDSDGGLYVPYRDCDPGFRWLYACWVEDDRGECDWFLVGK